MIQLSRGSPFLFFFLGPLLLFFPLSRLLHLHRCSSSSPANTRFDLSPLLPPLRRRRCRHRNRRILFAMEEIVKEPNSATEKSGRLTSRLLRYPLRSAASKHKEEKPPVTDASNGSASRSRGGIASTVSKSVSVLDLSSKEKSAKPPRRMSIPAKSSASPASAPKPAGNVTPMSEARAKRSTVSSVKSDTPASDISKSSTRRNFNRLSSAPYWVSQIKLSESAAKHSIYLGFFKLALEAECEPLQLLRDELKAYVRRHNLADFGEALKELFVSYNISEKLDQLHVSETGSFVLEEENRSSDDDVRNSSSITSINEQKLKPSKTGASEVSQVKDMNKETAQKNSSGTGATSEVSQVKEKKNETSQKNDPSTKTRRRSARTNAANPRSGGGNTQNPRKQESNKAMDKVKKQGKKSSDEEGQI